MLAAVIPACNEEAGVAHVINGLLKLPFDLIIPVVNGSEDETLQACFAVPSSRIHVLLFKDPLGVDIPRAVGAYFAYKAGATGVIFVDGDMTGDLHQPLKQIILALNSGVDCALINCYPFIYRRHSLAKKVLGYREILNRKMGIFHKLGLATPSHGPHGISKKLLEELTIEELAIPPAELALAGKKGLHIEVVAAIGHQQLGSPDRSPYHTSMMAQTIIGDCIDALCVLSGTARHRSDKGISYWGYHPQRRFDILKDFYQGQPVGKVITVL
ncbi:MAG: glycosyltransferase family A protein [Desulfitobacteriaceae bacterium]|nr:glycosyltransferase family A protein [Desulfitobacteriaceae bacterium]MDD4754213.1 glycosyltransferase family A protein [Desulfitobacteriaceae bacterium]